MDLQTVNVGKFSDKSERAACGARVLRHGECNVRVRRASHSFSVTVQLSAPPHNCSLQRSARGKSDLRSHLTIVCACANNHFSPLAFRQRKLLVYYVSVCH